ncbi:hypothetical protein B7494_g1562 [Chlorociboria aeruginascens]|nr:hypothetical protein B7494_g1562 [Chlorociboria aeruginascens]
MALRGEAMEIITKTNTSSPWEAFLKTGVLRLVRFVPRSDDSAILIGQPVDEVLDVGAAVHAGKEVLVQVFSGASVLEPGAPTDKVLTIKKLLSPLAQEEVGTIRCIGLNYAQHAREAKMELPTIPTLFLKPSTALADPWPAQYTIPKFSLHHDSADYESELAIVIGRTAKDVSEAEALDYVLGYTAANDISSRFDQFAQTQWCFSKGFDGSCPIVSTKLVPDTNALRLRGLKNGKILQNCGINFCSQGTTLTPGTIILTGTPAGVGFSFDPKEYLRDTDEFAVEILPHIGTLVTQFVNGKNESKNAGDSNGMKGLQLQIFRQIENVSVPAKRMAEKQEKIDYMTWSNEKLIERVTQLELELGSKNQSVMTTPPKKTYKKTRAARFFDPSKYNTRLIALKLAYLGKNYNGFEYHAGTETPRPTIEEELWKALNKARLIFPKDTHPLNPGNVNFEGCEYSKCGRTDKGVSAFGQVIAVRVRSNRPLAKKHQEEEIEEQENRGSINTYPQEGGIGIQAMPITPSYSQKKANIEKPPTPSIEDADYEDSLNFDPVTDEINYPSVLNRLLPPDIRILAWCPFPPIGFSARFSCRERRYRYFFTQPAFAPIPHQLEQRKSSNTTLLNADIKDGWLDIAAMREAARLFEGVHDFRNFCKVDPSKQISNYERKIYYSDIEEVQDQTGALAYVNGSSFSPTSDAGSEGFPKIYSFTLHGSAFLWHQVRHMVAILFLVAQRLESPSIVSELLDIEKNPRRPCYEMATDTPLVLWECIFPQEGDETRTDALHWVYVGDGPNNGESKYGTAGLLDDLWEMWRERKVDEVLAGTLLDVVAKQGQEVESLSVKQRMRGRSQRVFDGDNTPRLQGVYTPVMRKPRMESVHVVNERYAVKRGFEDSEDMKNQGYRRLNGQAVVGNDGI